MELWNAVKGYEGLYSVSNEGRVRREPREIIISGASTGRSKSYTRRNKGGVLKPFINNKGYEVVDLYNGGKESKKHKYVHRLVYEGFHGEIKNEIDHIDRDPLNNNLDNLRDISRSENMHNVSESGNRGARIEYRGVYEDRRRGTFNFTRQIMGKKYSSYGYDTPEEAYLKGLETLLAEANLTQ